MIILFKSVCVCVCVCVNKGKLRVQRHKERGLHKGKQMYYLLLMTRSMHRSLRLSRSFIKASIGHLHHRHIGTGGGQAVRFAVHYHLPTLQKDKQDQYRCDDYEIHNQPFLCVLFCGVAGRRGMRLAWKQGLLERLWCCWTTGNGMESQSIIIVPSLSRKTVGATLR